MDKIFDKIFDKTVDTAINFEDLKLGEGILKAIKNMGFEKPLKYRMQLSRLRWREGI